MKLSVKWNVVKPNRQPHWPGNHGRLLKYLEAEIVQSMKWFRMKIYFLLIAMNHRSCRECSQILCWSEQFLRSFENAENIFPDWSVANKQKLKWTLDVAICFPAQKLSFKSSRKRKQSFSSSITQWALRNKVFPPFLTSLSSATKTKSFHSPEMESREAMRKWFMFGFFPLDVFACNAGEHWWRTSNLLAKIRKRKRINLKHHETHFLRNVHSWNHFS